MSTRMPFNVYHATHPEVWRHFEKFALQAANSKLKRFGARAIIERIRWHVGIEKKKGDVFKLDNNYGADYARIFLKKYPQYESLFETRKRKV